MLTRLKNLILVYLLKKPVGGLYDEVDERNFGARVIAGEATRADLSDAEFQNIYPKLADQGATDFCVGFSKKYAKEATEHREMSGSGAYAMGCRALGYIPSYGTSILAVMNGAQKYGVPEQRKWPHLYPKSLAADWLQMGKDVLENAMLHRDESYFMVQDQYGWDRFDLFRAYLNKLSSYKVVIQTGVDGHAVTLIGQKVMWGELCLFGPDSYGLKEMSYRIGKSVGGYRYFRRWEANQLFNGYIAFDMKRSLAELLNRYDGKAVKLEDSDECYLVKGGMKHHLRNEAIAWANDTLLFGENYVFVLPQDEFDLIPTGNPATFGEGANHEIVRRILEKTGRADLIDEE